MNGKKLFHEDSETYYQTLVEISPDAVLIIHPDGKIVEANTKAMQFFSLAKDKSINEQNIYNIIQPEDHDRARTSIGKVSLNEELHDAEYKVLRQDGTILWASVSAKLISSPGKDPNTILILIRDISNRKIAEETLRNLAVTDDLTGLYNRRGFVLAAEQELKHAHRRKEGLVLLFFDLDNLKTINDSYGHAEGDKAIKEAARVLRTAFRESDIVARWGGDEFIVLALDIPQGRIHALLNRLDQIVRKYCEDHTFVYNISLSRGIAHYNPGAPLSLTELEKIADEMMYKEKQDKKAHPDKVVDL